MGRNLIETVMGAVVLVVAALFVAFIYDQRTVSASDGYPLKAKFDNVAGISSGSEVRIGGIKIGTVTSMDLEKETYRPVVSLQLKNTVKVPTDSSAAIVSEGLLGGKYVEIQPGAEEGMLKNGEEILFTQSSVNLEQMIGKFMFSGGGVENDGEEKQGASKEAPAAAAPSILE